MKKEFRVLLALLILLFFNSCNSVSSPVTTSVPTEVLGDYPVPEKLGNLTTYPVPGNASITTETVSPALSGTAPDPLPGKGSISGVLVSFTSHMVLKDTLFYLKPITGGDFPRIFVGPEPEKGDIVSRSDEEGRFSINNLPPGNYILVVEAYYDWLVALQSPEVNSPPLIINVQEGKKQSLGVVNVGGP
ncbi:hypothetical protein SE15_06885 [Thermanaerothrix daxensis]|uniref:Carboxypeptidase regulatory-like domain-containing protein n=1 Tax=Thermanaerothrix daxensis TaxID=869279 RepID=A0A0P6Y2Q4_9CHLR|nr:carboxypeptidase-like regulatory domain-containing protein [Thermanaerothrix daxensis]KPL83398.1 hypothetical protein SE15_06885 [Thermanaerothrix daxensis]